MLCCLAQDTEAVNLLRRWRAPGEMKCLELGFSASHPVQSSPSPRDTSDSSASSGIVDLVLWKSLAYIYLEKRGDSTLEEEQEGERGISEAFRSGGKKGRKR